jgi:hypothetical protein
MASEVHHLEALDTTVFHDLNSDSNRSPDRFEQHPPQVNVRRPLREVQHLDPDHAILLVAIHKNAA